MTQTTKAFTQDTAEKLGVGRRTVERQVQIAKNLTPETKEIIRGAEVSVTRKQALALSRLAPGPQAQAAALLSAGKIRSVDEYAPPVRAGPAAAPGCTPEALASEASELAGLLRRTADRCDFPAGTALLPAQRAALRRQMDGVREAVGKFEKVLEVMLK